LLPDLVLAAYVERSQPGAHGSRVVSVIDACQFGIGDVRDRAQRRG